MSAKPLTPDEERELREAIESCREDGYAYHPSQNELDALFATLDAEREERDDYQDQYQMVSASLEAVGKKADRYEREARAARRYLSMRIDKEYAAARAANEEAERG